MRPVVRVLVEESSQVAEARRAAMSAAALVEFDEGQIGQVAIVATEASTNLLKHAGGGELLIAPHFDSRGHTLTIYALDKGRGMADLTACMQDGFSTAGSPGTGLGAIQRQSQGLQVYSQPGKGTALVARFWAKNSLPAKPAIEVDGFSVPLRGETECGDSWSVHHHDEGCVFLAVDGLGHGPLAANAAQQAVKTFQQQPHLAPLALLQEIHGAQRGSRGSAAAVISLSTVHQTVEFAGVGNISAAIVEEGKGRHMVSVAGILGQDVRSWRQFSYPWSRESLLIIHSDGLSARWDLTSYPGLAVRPTALIAGVLYRDFARTRDDATVIVARERAEDP